MAAELLLLRVSPFPLNHYKRSSQCILLRKVSMYTPEITKSSGPIEVSQAVATSKQRY